MISTICDSPFIPDKSRLNGLGSSGSLLPVSARGNANESISNPPANPCRFRSAR